MPREDVADQQHRHHVGRAVPCCRRCDISGRLGSPRASLAEQHCALVLLPLHYILHAACDVFSLRPHRIDLLTSRSALQPSNLTVAYSALSAAPAFNYLTYPAS